MNNKLGSLCFFPFLNVWWSSWRENAGGYRCKYQTISSIKTKICRRKVSPQNFTSSHGKKTVSLRVSLCLTMSHLSTPEVLLTANPLTFRFKLRCPRHSASLAMTTTAIPAFQHLRVRRLTGFEYVWMPLLHQLKYLWYLQEPWSAPTHGPLFGTQ